MKDEQEDVSMIDEYQEPEWLKEALAQGRTTAEFRERCEDAALTARSMVKLRLEREKLGFVPLTFAVYVQGLAKLAGVAVDSVLKFYQVSGLEVWEDLRWLARLARDLGFSRNEASALLRIWRVEGSDLAPFPMMVAARRPGFQSRDS